MFLVKNIPNVTAGFICPPEIGPHITSAPKKAAAI